MSRIADYIQRKTDSIVDRAGASFVVAWILQWMLVHLSLLLIASFSWLFDAPDWTVWLAQLYMLVFHRWDTPRVDLSQGQVYRI